LSPEDVADDIAAQVLDGFADGSRSDLYRLCMEAEEWWVMGADARPYAIRAWAHWNRAGVTVRVRVDTHGWTWTEPALRAVLVEVDPDRWRV
jgi:hypothetical protein